MLTIALLVIMTIVIFAIARRNKNPKAFMQLMLCMLIGIMVGTMLKSTTVAQTTVETKITVIDSLNHPTLSVSPAFVGTAVNNDTIMSQEPKLEFEGYVQNTDDKKGPTQLQKCEIEDDS